MPETHGDINIFITLLFRLEGMKFSCLWSGFMPLLD